MRAVKNNEITEKLRFLCIHGYGQNGSSFKAQTGAFRKHVNKYAEFVFLDAPHESAKRVDSDRDRENGRSWWSNMKDGSFNGKEISATADGFEDSVRLVEQAWTEQGPFHGLLGFSQGAAFVGLLCGLSVRGLTCINPQFAVICAGFRSGCLAHLAYYDSNIPIPSIHIYGESDEIIPGEYSKCLSECFTDPIIKTHEGGHYFPGAAKLKPFYVEHFQNMLVGHLEAKELGKAAND